MEKRSTKKKVCPENVEDRFRVREFDFFGKLLRNWHDVHNTYVKYLNTIYRAAQK